VISGLAGLQKLNAASKLISVIIIFVFFNLLFSISPAGKSTMFQLVRELAKQQKVSKKA